MFTWRTSDKLTIPSWSSSRISAIFCNFVSSETFCNLFIDRTNSLMLITVSLAEVSSINRLHDYITVKLHTKTYRLMQKKIEPVEFEMEKKF